ncbi:MAG: hypothetical protein JKY54_03095 [Flavobacteriales bacterium]|nr:hypothetical protein [Flavobacteriales bacterium]
MKIAFLDNIYQHLLTAFAENGGKWKEKTLLPSGYSKSFNIYSPFAFCTCNFFLFTG